MGSSGQNTNPKKQSADANSKQLKKPWFQWPRFRIPHKNVIYDKFHRGAVLTLVSLTVIIMVRIGVDVYHYRTVRRPIMMELARLQQEENMEEMQKEKEQERLRLLALEKEQQMKS